MGNLTEPLNVRLAPKAKAALEERAAAESRPASVQARVYIEAGLELDRLAALESPALTDLIASEREQGRAFGLTAESCRFILARRGIAA